MPSMATLGNRLICSGFSLCEQVRAGKPGDYEVPGEYLDDETFAAMLARAQKYISYPYVWGGSSPATSFDCSVRFVGYQSLRLECWAGWSPGGSITSVRRPALPNPVIWCSSEAPMTPGVSRCGIYVGDGKMLHCGDPIGYANLNTSYWQSHFI